MDTLLAPDVTAYVVGGFLLLGTGVLLLFHCSSISERKKRQRVEHCANDAVGKGFFRPWRYNRKKSPVLHKFDVPAVIITPPSPLVSRLGLDDDEDSIGSSSDLEYTVVVVSEVRDGEEVVTVAQESRKTSTPSCVPQDGVDVFRDFDSPEVLPCRRSSLSGSSSQSDKAGSGSGSGATSSYSGGSSQDGSSQSSSTRGSTAQQLPPVDGSEKRGRLSSDGSASTGSSSSHTASGSGSSAHTAGVDGSWSHEKTSPVPDRSVSARSDQRSVLTLSDADGDEEFLDDVEPSAMRPRLSSMEPGTSKKDFNIPVMVHSDTK